MDMYKYTDGNDVIDCVRECVEDELERIPLSGVELVSYCVNNSENIDNCEECEGGCEDSDEVEDLLYCEWHVSSFRKLLTRHFQQNARHNQ